MQLNQREGDKNHPGATGGNLISRRGGRGGKNDVQSIAIVKNTPSLWPGVPVLAVEKNLRERGRNENVVCLQNQTDDIRGGGVSRITNSPLSFVRSGHRNV